MEEVMREKDEGHCEGGGRGADGGGGKGGGRESSGRWKRIEGGSHEVL